MGAIRRLRQNCCMARPPKIPLVREDRPSKTELKQESAELQLLGEALTEQAGPQATVERQTGDGLLMIRLEPLAAGSRARIKTPHGSFTGRDHVITITPTLEGR